MAYKDAGKKAMKKSGMAEIETAPAKKKKPIKSAAGGAPKKYKSPDQGMSAKKARRKIK